MVEEAAPEPRRLAEILYQEFDAIQELGKRSEKELIAEARRHRIFRVLTTCPGMGDIRVAQMLPIVVTPYRFASKRSFWAYAGLAIVMRSSSDWVRTQRGDWIRAQVPQTRGLNHNRSLKQIFKGAATTIITFARSDDPIFQHYERLLAGGTKPNLAKLTIARQIASLTLSMWRPEEVYDPKKLQAT